MKQLTATAISAMMARNGWKPADAAEQLGCSRATIVNRLDQDDDSKPLTVHELLRATQADGPHLANAIFASVAYQLVPDQFDDHADALRAAGNSARCAAALIEANADGRIDRAEWRVLLPILEDLDRAVSAMIVEGRRALAGER